MRDLKNHFILRATESELAEDLKTAREENKELREHIRIQKENLCRVEDEKSSLLTALTLMKERETKKTTDCTNNDVSFVSQRESQSTVPGDIAAETQSSVPGDDEEIEESDTHTWTRVERRNKPRSQDLLLIGDSMVKNLDPQKMSKRPMAKRVYRGCKLQDIKAEEDKLSPQGITTILIHTGTNNLPNTADGPKTIARHLEELGSSLQDREGNCEIIISGIINRDDTEYDEKISASNTEIRSICRKKKWYVVDNGNLDSSCLNSSNLHLNTKGDSILASNLIRAIRRKSRPYSSDRGNKRGNFQGGRQQSVMLDFLNLLGRLR